MTNSPDICTIWLTKMTCPYLLVYPLSVRLSIRNDNSLIRTKRSFHSFRVKAALLRYIVFYCELGCDTSEPQVSYISRACSSLVRRPYYAPNCIISKIRGLETILATKKGRWDGRSFYMDEYTLIFLFSRCIRCAQKRDCWESVRFASERSRVRIPLGPPICRIVLYDAAFFMPKKLWQTVPGSEP